MHGVKRRRVPNTNITLFTWRWSSAKFFNYLHMLLQSPDQTKPMIGFPLQWFPNSTKPYLICFVSQFLPFCLSLASCCYLCHVCLFRQAVAFLFRSSLAQPVLPLPCEAETKHLSNSERQPLWGGDRNNRPWVRPAGVGVADHSWHPHRLRSECTETKLKSLRLTYSYRRLEMQDLLEDLWPEQCS